MIPRPRGRLARPPITIDTALGDANLLGTALGSTATWQTWFAVMRAAFGLSLNDDQRVAFDKLAGHRPPPDERVTEVWAVAGRRSGKSRMAAALLVFFALLAPLPALAQGEQAHVICISASRGQAAVVLRYVLGFIEASPILRRQILQVKAEEIVLRNGVVIGVHTSSFRTIRGRTIIAAVFDECAFWRDETSAMPDVELYRAVLPSLAASRGMLVAISSPYRKVGLLYTKHRDHYGQDGDVLVITAPSTELNPTLDPNIIANARAADPEAALAEWDGMFRTDLSSLLTDDVVDAAIDHSRPPELPRQSGVRYRCFVDASAGRHDHFTCAIAHKDGERIVIDCLRGAAPPCDPNTVATEYAALAEDYGCNEIVGDNFAAEWVAASFKSAGVKYTRSELTRSELYLEALPIFNRHAVSLPNHPRMIRELRLLERRVHRSGKDSVDHGTGGSDDYANSVCGAIHLVAGKKEIFRVTASALAMAQQPAAIRPHTNLFPSGASAKSWASKMFR